MRRLMVIHYPFFGGPHNQALRLSAPLQRRGIETTVLLPSEPGNASHRLREAGIDVVELPLARLRSTPNPLIQLRYFARFARDVRRIRELIRERDIGLVEIAGLVNAQGALAARREHVPVVWQLLDTRAPALLRRALMPVVLQLGDSIMSTGRKVAAVHPGMEDLNGRLTPFFPPVDTRVFHPDMDRRRAIRARLEIPADAVVIGCVANITPQKGLENFLEAASLIRVSVPASRFVIFGRAMETQGAYVHTIRRKAAALGVDVVNPGDRVADFVRVLDVFVLTAGQRSEGISTTVLEAMASGVPVVSTDVGALSEAVESGVTGFIVPASDNGAIASAAVLLARDTDTRLAMGERSRKRAIDLFDVEKCAEAHVRAYEQGLERARARGWVS
jgi:glycosyltransferase involved in cell wall biosynthesis